MIAVVDYGLGNLRSVHKVVLPRVGAFAEGISGLRSRGLLEVLKTVAAAGKPFLGICLGMQLLFETSEETGSCGGGRSDARRGLALLPGLVRRFPEAGLKVPQTGWNRLHLRGRSALFRRIPPGSFVYFNHGYYCDPDQRGSVSAYSDYGIRYAAAVQRGSLYGVQFHPEKSQAVGLRILHNFVEVC